MLGHTIGKRLYLQLLKGRREEAGRSTPTLFFLHRFASRSKFEAKNATINSHKDNILMKQMGKMCFS